MEPDVGRLLEEQAALRRVATMVARGTDRLGVIRAVAEEVGRLLDADVTNLVRFEGEYGTIVGGWSDGLMEQAPVDFRVSMDRDSTAARVRDAGRATRVDLDNESGEVFTSLREMGVRTSVGAPIVVDGEIWGAVIAGSTRQMSFAPDAEQRLTEFAELVAQALANAEAREELAASRKRLVEAAQLERRRLERNLHDGAQQRLVGLALTLRLVERQVDGAARDMLARASAELAEALQELRELARGLHPAVLTDHGLEAALGSLADRAPLPVEAERRPRRAAGRAAGGGRLLRRRGGADERRPLCVRHNRDGDRAPGGGRACVVEVTDDGARRRRPERGHRATRADRSRRGARRTTRGREPGGPRHDGQGMSA